MTTREARKRPGEFRLGDLPVNLLDMGPAAVATVAGHLTDRDALDALGGSVERFLTGLHSIDEDMVERCYYLGGDLRDAYDASVADGLPFTWSFKDVPKAAARALADGFSGQSFRSVADHLGLYTDRFEPDIRIGFAFRFDPPTRAGDRTDGPNGSKPARVA